jgi:hypothetical protein
MNLSETSNAYRDHMRSYVDIIPGLSKPPKQVPKTDSENKASQNTGENPLKKLGNFFGGLVDKANERGKTLNRASDSKAEAPKPPPETKAEAPKPESPISKLTVQNTGDENPLKKVGNFLGGLVDKANERGKIFNQAPETKAEAPKPPPETKAEAPKPPPETKAEAPKPPPETKAEAPKPPPETKAEDSLINKTSKWLSDTGASIGQHVKDNATPYGIGAATVAAGLGAKALYNRAKRKKEKINANRFK